MEIGTEISKKIRTAIKGKLQELGAYVDEELPDYIMVMVANKKNPKQMADDLSLFLGNNTIKFTVWLHGVLDKLRSVAVEPTSLPPSVLLSETSIPAENNRRGAEPCALAVSSSRSDKLEGRVSSSAHENSTRYLIPKSGSSERPSRLTSTVKPLMEESSEAVIDIKPDLDDDLIGYDSLEQSLTSQALYSRSTANRPRSALESSRQTADTYRSSDVTRGQERSGSSRSYRSSAESSRELSRKRKATALSPADRELDEVEDMNVEPVQATRQKLPERCKFWPACKSGDECLYHHPNTQCKMFPNCKFGNKCLFIHPNCKFDAKCSKVDCPFTHVSRRLNSNPTRADPAPASTVCHFFPECKKPDCPFYHPKPCRFAAQCKREGCTFYHPAVAVPPRSALKWTKTQSR
ncbi:zinc finger CCCH domain-containing protein 14-like [Sinocyclocheilus grahami]|uniref:zinc finger CCCH domain-containing protein 14-like n=1 Tax=Sinocyclocheilus grahami TaxID=75366 RepID=UPI0007ACF25C|nr:PREDICTED: zinc finger CCCH domain-containing protein 14-like [Sinocyclocheilus grahami]